MKADILPSEFFMHALGVRIKQLRKERNLTQVQLAKLASISRVSLYQLESGQANPKFLTLCAIAEALGCDLATLVGIVRPNTAPEPVRPLESVTVYTPLFPSTFSSLLEEKV